MGGQTQAPTASTPAKDAVPILQEAGWALEPVWTGGKSRPRRDSIPNRPPRSQSLYRLSYRGTQNICHKSNVKPLKIEAENWTRPRVTVFAFLWFCLMYYSPRNVLSKHNFRSVCAVWTARVAGKANWENELIVGKWRFCNTGWSIDASKLFHNDRFFFQSHQHDVRTSNYNNDLQYGKRNNNILVAVRITECIL